MKNNIKLICIYFYKMDRIWRLKFNKLFRELCVEIKENNSSNDTVLSQIDLILNKILKNKASPIIINNFYDNITSIKELNTNIKNENYKFFETYKHETYGENDIFKCLKNMFLNYENKEDLMKRVNDLRKISVAYRKVID